MPRGAEELAEIITRLIKQHQKERPRLDRIAAYMRNKVDAVYSPQGATDEFRELVDQARFNILPLVEDAVAQTLFVDGYRPTGENGRAPSTANAPVWDAVWQPNRLDARQAAFYRPAIRYGYSYATALPGKPAPVVRPYSPRKLTALYEDPVNDEWPLFAMVAQRPPVKALPAGGDPLETPTVETGATLVIYDDEYRYHVIKEAGGWRLITDAEQHGQGVVPVVRFLDQVGDEDDDGVVCRGKIEPLLPVQRQLNQTTYGLLMAQHYSAFKQRWVTGMVDEEPKFRARVDAMLRSESPDSKFGEFSETDLSGYLNSRDKALLYVSAVAQIPPHNLLVGSGISNISAEALAALESAHRHDIAEHQSTFGESIEQLMRLAGRAMDDDEAWEDTSAQVVWRDTTPRSLAQVADALGKMAQLLGIPVEVLWERIPGVTDQDIARWKEARDEQTAMDALASFEREIAAVGREDPDAVDAGQPQNGSSPAAA
jgi:hypothetical protein